MGNILSKKLANKPEKNGGERLELGSVWSFEDCTWIVVAWLAAMFRVESTRHLASLENIAAMLALESVLSDCKWENLGCRSMLPANPGIRGLEFPVNEIVAVSVDVPWY